MLEAFSWNEIVLTLSRAEIAGVGLGGRVLIGRRITAWSTNVTLLGDDRGALAKETVKVWMIVLWLNFGKFEQKHHKYFLDIPGIYSVNGRGLISENHWGDNFVSKNKKSYTCVKVYLRYEMKVCLHSLNWSGGLILVRSMRRGPGCGPLPPPRLDPLGEPVGDDALLELPARLKIFAKSVVLHKC